MQQNFIEIHVYDYCHEAVTQINIKNSQHQINVEEHVVKKNQNDNLISKQQYENCQQDSDK